jgi:hypothetical protein
MDWAICICGEISVFSGIVVHEGKYCRRAQTVHCPEIAIYFGTLRMIGVDSVWRHCSKPDAWPSRTIGYLEALNRFRKENAQKHCFWHPFCKRLDTWKINLN